MLDKCTRQASGFDGQVDGERELFIVYWQNTSWLKYGDLGKRQSSIVWIIIDHLIQVQETRATETYFYGPKWLGNVHVK